MLSMAAMMKNIKMGSRRMYWDRVRHPVSEKHELSGQNAEAEMPPHHHKPNTPAVRNSPPHLLTLGLAA